MPGERGAGRLAEAGDDVDDAGRAGFLNQFAKAQRGEGCLLGGLGTTVQPVASAAPVSSRHEQRKFHGMICPTTPPAALGVGEELCAGAVGDGHRCQANFLAQPAM